MCWRRRCMGSCNPTARYKATVMPWRSHEKFGAAKRIASAVGCRSSLGVLSSVPITVASSVCLLYRRRSCSDAIAGSRKCLARPTGTYMLSQRAQWSLLSPRTGTVGRRRTPGHIPMHVHRSNRGSAMRLCRTRIERRCRILVCIITLSVIGLSIVPSSLRAQSATSRLAEPAVLRNVSTKAGVVEVNIDAAPARIAMIPGHLTDAYAYNGTVPGPTLEAREGDRVIIHFTNHLPEARTVHWHGVHLPAVMDGSPFELVQPGGHYDYVFTIPRGSAGTYWYHPHPDGRSEYQVVKGLFGAFIVRASDDPIKAIPEKLLILSDNRFRADGSMDFPDSTSLQAEADEENGRDGNVMFVNGQIMPSIDIRSNEVQRWRIINASAARVYRLAIPGHTLLHVGSDGGLFEHPIESKDVLVANSERVEILVRGSGAPGSRVELQALPYDRYMQQTRPADWNMPRALLAFRYSSAAPIAPVTLPAALRRVVPLDTMAATQRRTIVLSQGLDRRQDDGHGSRRRSRGDGRDRDMGSRKRGRHGPSIPSPRIPVSTARPKRCARAVSELEGRREHSEARVCSLHRAICRLPRQVDVSLPHSRARGSRHDGDPRSAITFKGGIVTRTIRSASRWLGWVLSAGAAIGCVQQSPTMDGRASFTSAQRGQAAEDQILLGRIARAESRLQWLSRWRESRLADVARGYDDAGSGVSRRCLRDKA